MWDGRRHRRTDVLCRIWRKYFSIYNTSREIDYDDEGVHQIEHPNWERKGIYHFKDEQEAIEKINKIYVEMAAGEARPVTEFFTVDEGLSFKDFNDYVNSLDEYNLKK